MYKRSQHRQEKILLRFIAGSKNTKKRELFPHYFVAPGAIEETVVFPMKSSLWLTPLSRSFIYHSSVVRSPRPVWKLPESVGRLVFIRLTPTPFAIEFRKYLRKFCLPNEWGTRLPGKGSSQSLAHSRTQTFLLPLYKSTIRLWT